MAASRGSFGSYANGPPSTSQRDSASANDFTRLSNVISNNIQKMTTNVTQMQAMLLQCGTKLDTPDLRDRLHQCQHNANQLAKDTSQKLKDLNQIPLLPDQKQHKVQREKLVSEFSNVLKSFQSAQRQEKDKEKVRVDQARSSSTSVSYDPFSESKGGYHQMPNEPSSNQMNVQIDASDIDQEILREREEALRKLEADIVDVNIIFKDLGMLVHEQGDMIDSIEANVETAAVSVEEGTEQLRQARDYQSKARKKKCIIITILLIILAIIIIIIAVAVTQSKN